MPSARYDLSISAARDHAQLRRTGQTLDKGLDHAAPASGGRLSADPSTSRRPV
jgi:hypothetical protein